jgi:GH15 family glucan-1,4-alpha-glucosidase
MSMYRDCFLNGVWMFEKAVDRDDLKAGKLDERASVHIRCGHEALTDVAATVDLELAADHIEGCHLVLPYDLPKADAPRVAGISLSEAKAATVDRWNSFLAGGAQFTTGVPHLDNLYRTCVVNILLMRTRYPGAAADGNDLYVVKPGAGIYDNFWTRDGSYIATSLGLAGYARENEQSLRLFWQHGLKGMFASWGQQPAGFWQAPLTQWDSNGQALWALVQHFQLTRDREWLTKVYPSIRKGALWIRNACEQMKFTNEKGERPTYYGLLPPGEGESIASGINYYHDFWAVLGLRQATIAAEAMGETADVELFSSAHDDLCSNLVRSVSWAFQRAGEGKYIPATPFQPGGSIWGSANALYPCRFLDPGDPIMSATLATLDSKMEEDVYIYVKRHLWTYITADIAMCHLLRNELDQFYRFYNGFVAHASPTNAWAEGIICDERRGTGDMPHGWAAAEYIFLHRNSLVYENGNSLELCWGVQPGWLSDGSTVSARNAPTHFGKVNLDVRRQGSKLAATYSLEGNGYPNPGKIAMHVPRLEGVNEITINSKRYPLEPGVNVVPVG